MARTSPTGSRAGYHPVLWLSEQAQFQPGKAIRGGIPVCWPWFGPHPNDPTAKAHGFARTAEWQVAARQHRCRRRRLDHAHPALHRRNRALGRMRLTWTLVVRASARRSRSRSPHATAVMRRLRSARRCIPTSRSVMCAKPASMATPARAYVDSLRPGAHQRATSCAAHLQRRDRPHLPEHVRLHADRPEHEPRASMCANAAQAARWSGTRGRENRAAGDVAPQAWPGFVCIEAANALDGLCSCHPAKVTHSITTLEATWLR